LQALINNAADIRVCCRRTANRAQATPDDREPKRGFASGKSDACTGERTRTGSSYLLAATARACAFCDLAARSQVRLVVPSPADARGVADVLSHLLRLGIGDVFRSLEFVFQIRRQNCLR
jgi:hypothetical protein